MLRRITLLGPLALLAAGVACSVAVAVSVEQRARDELRSDLQADAAELGLLLEQLVGGFESQLTSLAAIAVVTEGDPDVHRRFVTDNQSEGAHTLLDLATDPPTVIATAAVEDVDDPVDDGEVEANETGIVTLLDDPEFAEQLARIEDEGFGFFSTDDGTIVLAAVAPRGDARYADVSLFPVGTGGVRVLTEQVGGVDALALYLGDEPDPSQAVLATTDDLPLRGDDVVVERFEITGQSMTMEVTGSPSSTVTPGAVASTGIAVTLGLTLALWHALRRGDVAIAALETAANAERERARMEHDLQQAQRMEAIGQLAGGIAHDFNNLLAAISATAELLGLDADDPRTVEDVDEILQATRRGAALTKRLLTFSSRGPSAHEPLDLNAVVHDMEGLITRTLGERVEVVYDLAPGPVPVVGDVAEIEQVLLNLVVNARDAATDGGRRIVVTTTADDERAELAVADSGAGMSEEVRARAFDPFFSTKADGGTGLGLSIVYGIASRMGGDATIESRIGVGTTVRVSMPTARQPVRPDDAPVPAEPARPARARVLLVEDEPAVRRAAERLIARAGHDVTTAADGAEAVALVVDGLAPTVLLTDVVLPGDRTGRDVAAEVRRLVPGVRVVYASGHSRDLISDDQLADEDAAFVAKPFTSRALLAAIDAAGTASPRTVGATR